MRLRRSLPLTWPVVLLATLGACGGLSTEPGSGAVLIQRPEYAAWWAEVEACSGLRADFTTIRFYEYPGDIPGKPSAAGAARYRSRQIVFARGSGRSKNTMQHEALHMLTLLHGVGRSDINQEVWGKDHPPEYFGWHRYTRDSWTQGGKCSAILNEFYYLPTWPLATVQGPDHRR